MHCIHRALGGECNSPGTRGGVYGKEGGGCEIYASVLRHTRMRGRNWRTDRLPHPPQVAIGSPVSGTGRH